MDIKKLKQLIKLAKEEEVVKLEFGDQKSRYAVTLAQNQPVIVGQPLFQEGLQGVSKDAAVLGAKAFENSHLLEVKSPFVGTFYRCPASGQPPFVNKGDRVSLGQTLCILEAMKIMNEIDAEIMGEIVEICVEDESLVEYDQVLFKMST